MICSKLTEKFKRAHLLHEGVNVPRRSAKAENYPGTFFVPLWCSTYPSVAKNAYKNVITKGTLAGNDGRKMSKSLGNYTDPNELMDKFSADSLRFLLLSSPVLAGEDFALLDKDVSDVARKLSMVWNVYDFFCTYAEVDGWSSENFKGIEKLENELDKLEAEMAEWKQQDEDVLSYALFPQVAVEYFKYRQAQQEKVDPTQADTKNGAYPV